MSDTTDQQHIEERLSLLEARNARLRQQIVDSRAIGVNPGDSLEDLITRLCVCAWPEDTGRVWFGHWQRISRAARALIKEYDDCTPDWWPSGIDTLRESLGCGDKPTEVAELEAIVRDLAAAASRPDGERCKWCDTTGEHREHCVWQRSREFVSAHPVSGDPADA